MSINRIFPIFLSADFCRDFRTFRCVKSLPHQIKMLLLLFFCLVSSTDIWISSINGDIHYSTDNGDTFTQQTSGTTNALRAIAATSANNVWAVGDSGTVKFTTNAGTLWQTKSIGTSTGLNFIFWSSSSLGCIVGNSQFLSMTADSGSTWTTISQVTTLSIGNINSVFFIGSTGWACGTDGVGSAGRIIKSTTSGGTWSLLTIPASNILQTISFASTSIGVAGGLSGTILRTTNGGTSWSAVTAPSAAHMRALAFTSTSNGWATTSAGLWKTTDGGASWSTVSGITTITYNAITFPSPTTGWIIGATYYRTTDGNTWSSLTNPSASNVLGITGFGSLITTTTPPPTTAPAATYQVDRFYSDDLTCTGSETALFITQPSSCTPDSSCTNVNGFFGRKRTCETVPPTYPTGWTAIEIWQSSSSCQGISDGVLVVPDGTCSGRWQFSTILATCSTGIVQDCGATNSTCNGCSSMSATNTGVCTAGNPTNSISMQSYKWFCQGSSNVCFHESTEITYYGKKYGLEQLEQEKEIFRVPHVITSNGVSIKHTCNDKRLRLTSDHLVFTKTNWRTTRAGDLLPYQIIYGINGKECRVIDVQKEKNQKYFGLNCAESMVLANGVRTSTFGNYHFIPSIWMKIMSQIVGIQKASKFGDKLANFVYNIHKNHIRIPGL